jgi:hypothetical protein
MCVCVCVCCVRACVDFIAVTVHAFGLKESTDLGSGEVYCIQSG